MNYNRVILGGRLTRDPEVKTIASGAKVVDMGMAINRVTTGKDGRKHEETCFVDLVAWERTAETLAKYLRKGDPLLIEGRLQFNEWQDQGGGKRSKLRVLVERFSFVGRREGTEAQPVTEQAPVLVGERNSPPVADETIPF